MEHPPSALLHQSLLKSGNAAYIDRIYQDYQKTPDTIDPTWKSFFDGLTLGLQEGFKEGAEAALSHPELQNQPTTGSTLSSEDLAREFGMAEYIMTYRRLGHLQAQVNPLRTIPQAPALEFTRFGISETDYDRTYIAGVLIAGSPLTFRQIYQFLQSVYSASISIESQHLLLREEREYIRKKFETGALHAKPDPERRRFILKSLTATECFERFLHTRFVAQKRFSVEGGDNVVPMLESLFDAGINDGAETDEFVIGMAHRGRLNVLTHIMGKKAQWIFTEFEGNYHSSLEDGEGDVKYHKGWVSDHTTFSGKKVRLTLSPNPSHLEFVNPVVSGMARARQDLRKDRMREKICPITIHGDAALSGQGVCYETIQMATLPGYKTGGTIHIVINNQIGFTTSTHEARSAIYSTDLGRVIDSPILHVNGNDADACWQAAQFAIDYRNRFKKDVFIDLVCYRKHGHNEGDEPAFTQPLMYQTIKTLPSPREVYAERLAQDQVVSMDESQKLVSEKMDQFQSDLIIAREKKEVGHPDYFEGEWKGFTQGIEKEAFAVTKTKVSLDTIKQLNEKINRIPSTFNLHSKLGRFFEARLNAFDSGTGIDWGNGEAMAYATLLHEGYPVRITGQDAERGTFTHRHAVLKDTQTGESYCPLNQIDPNQKAFIDIHNSFLSETAVMGFEFGYSTEHPKALTIWEAQFGDFANGAQVIIDQFLCSSESKWHKMSGLVLLLPHGYEGQGPEHSSARLERFLQLSGRFNWTVGNFSTPAQIFHALRRQVHRPYRKPLIVMSPKSLLRLPAAVSSIQEFTDLNFQEVIDDPRFAESASAKKSVKRVILCSGKVYYDLISYRDEIKDSETAIVRIEQLYPFPAAMTESILKSYSSMKSLVWAQEEPRNMGAWQFVASQFNGVLADLGQRIPFQPVYAGREIGAAPAVGSPKIHEKQLQELLKSAFGV